MKQLLLVTLLFIFLIGCTPVGQVSQYVSESCPIAHYPMDEGSGVDLTDSITGKIGKFSTPYQGVVWENGAIAFDGVWGDQVDFNDALTIDTNTPFSISLWIKPQAKTASVSYGIISKMPGGIEVAETKDGKIQVWYQDTTRVSSMVDSAAITPNQWHNIIFSYDGTGTKEGMKLFVDNNQRIVGFSQGSSNPAFNTNSDLIAGIGKSGWTTGKFLGHMKDVRIYNRALSFSEISEIYSGADDIVSCSSATTGGEIISNICTDSDGGKDYSVLGTTSDGSITKEDKCNTIITQCAQFGRIQQTCPSIKYLEEQYCEDGVVKTENHNCNCQDGVCIPCIDTDGGKDYATKGSTSQEDLCVQVNCITTPCPDSTQLQERYCEDGNEKTETYTCPGKCVDGACVAGETVQEENTTSIQNCNNGIKDGTETAIDCGGSCNPCAEGKACKVNADCAVGPQANTLLNCYNQVCTKYCKSGYRDCDSNILNGCETEGLGGKGCACQSNSDCASSSCNLGKCTADETTTQVTGPSYDAIITVSWSLRSPGGVSLTSYSPRLKIIDGITSIVDTGTKHSGKSIQTITSPLISISSGKKYSAQLEFGGVCSDIGRLAKQGWDWQTSCSSEGIIGTCWGWCQSNSYNNVQRNTYQSASESRPWFCPSCQGSIPKTWILCYEKADFSADNCNVARTDSNNVVRSNVNSPGTLTIGDESTKIEFIAP